MPGQPHPTIRDRAPAMAGARAAGARVDVEEARSRQQFLKAAAVAALMTVANGSPLSPERHVS